MDNQPLALVPALVTPSVVPSPPPQPAWSLGKRIAFRFAFVYFGLYSFPFPLTELPKADKLCEPFYWLLHHIVPWFGKHALRIDRPITFGPNGSGDTTYDWVLVAFSLVFAAVVTLVWSIVDRRRPRYALGWTLFVIYTRYVLAMTMVGYGFLKVLGLQFSPPQFPRLAEAYGDSSPMGLLWTFMGYSVPYTMLAGFAELLGGTLLLFRRTTLLGALVLLGVMGNVVLLNLCYDVPVKLYATHLWLMALLLTLPESRRLVDFFVRQRAIEPLVVATPFARGRLRWVRWIVKPLFIINLFCTRVYFQREAAKASRNDGPQGAMNGPWDIVSATSGGQPVAPAWRRVTIMNKLFMVRRVDDSRVRYHLVDDGTKKQLTLTPAEDAKAPPSVVTYVRSGDHGVLDGTLDGKPLHVELKFIDTSKSLLMTRGFHWINEQPFNR
ncbi:MAG TPA: hypothetical protein VHB97_08990 [Polyangia bacterium]|nr:hypothetical protein [Polyangia bacterium]